MKSSVSVFNAIICPKDLNFGRVLVLNESFKVLMGATDGWPLREYASAKWTRAEKQGVAT